MWLVPHVEGTGRTDAIAHKWREGGVDEDVALRVMGARPATLARSLCVDPGVKQVAVRYRLVDHGARLDESPDVYWLTLRSERDGRLVSATSANGAGAIDGLGLAWRSLALAVEEGETVRLEAGIAGGGEGAELAIDLVQQTILRTVASQRFACPHENVTFTVETGFPGMVEWTGGGVPETGYGRTFVTRFSSPGRQRVAAMLNGERVETEVTIGEPSGSAWPDRFPDLARIDALEPNFADGVARFVAALEAAGATVELGSTYRPRERAYLMHHAWMIARRRLHADKVEPMDGVDICWAPRDENGAITTNTRLDWIRRARQMTMRYDIAYRPSLTSNHTAGLAIDMSISWVGPLDIVDAHGETWTIKGGPRSGTNGTLKQVGRTYGVRKFRYGRDAPHWSHDGR